MQPNIFIRRVSTAAIPVSPQETAPGTTNGSLDACAVALAYNPATGNIISVANPVPLWPAVTTTPYNGAGTPPAMASGIRTFKAPGGIVDYRTFNIGLAQITSGVFGQIRAFGSSVVSDITRFWMGSLNDVRYVHGLDLGGGLGAPLQGLVAIDGRGVSSLQAGVSLITTPQYPYAVQTVFDTAQPNFSGRTVVDTLISGPVPTSTNVKGISQLALDWVDPAIPINNSYVVIGGVCAFDLGLFIDPNFINSEQNAQTDLYIKLPFSIGSSGSTKIFPSVDSGDIAVGGVLAIGNYEGAIRNVIVPVSLLKAGPVTITFNVAQTGVAGDIQNQLMQVLPETSTVAGLQFMYPTVSVSYQISLSAIPDSNLAVPSFTFTKPNVGPK